MSESLIERLNEVLDIVAAAEQQWAETDEHHAYYSDKHKAVQDAIEALSQGPECPHEQQTGDGVWYHGCLDCGHDFLLAKKKARWSTPPPPTDRGAIVMPQDEPSAENTPFGYAYRYPYWNGGTVIRYNGGGEVNGSKPIETIPLYTKKQALAMQAPATPAEALPEVEQMVERLTRERMTRMYEGDYINPDGPKAAALLTSYAAKVRDVVGILERRRSIYQAKYDAAVTREWERDPDNTPKYSRSELFQHAAEAIEHAIEEVSAALKGSAQEQGTRAT